MNQRPQYDVIIVGGGLAGLTSAIVLAKAGRQVLLLEKKTYPYHKVCGEYISNEVLEYLRSLGFDPFAFGAATIGRLRLSTPAGKCFYLPLDLGGFGISRYTMDEALCRLAIQNGADVKTGARVDSIQFGDETFTVTTQAGDSYTSRLVIGSYGKRETLDKKLGRDFIAQRSNYLGVKYHIRTELPAGLIALDNFENGYCGVSQVDGDRYNLCYLYHRPEAQAHRSIPELEQEVLYKNPVLRKLFTESIFLFDTPEVINQVCFDARTQVEQHILMCGDTAGLITPLCGNGMAMAVSGAQLLTGIILKSGILDMKKDTRDRRWQLETTYQQAWNKRFRTRLYWGRTIQRFFGNPLLTGLTLRTLHAIPPLQRRLMSLTHGQPLE